MSEKRFRTRMQWSNTRVVLVVAPFLVVLAAGLAFARGYFLLLGAMLALTALALAVAVIRDRGRPGTYRIGGGVLELKRGSDKLVVRPEDILDASLIERRACRDYVRKRLGQQAGRSAQELKAMRDDFLRFSTVDVGLRNYSFGIGRLFIDRMETARNDLVLLRTRSGEEYILSPEFNQDMVESIERMKRRQAASEGAR